MQSGDLAGGSLGDVLRSLASDTATGGLHVQRHREKGNSRDSVLYLHEGALYAATSSGPRPLLGVRLVAAGAVTREALQEALESQAGDLAGWRLGELLVHLGYVDADIVTEFVIEQLLDTVGEVLSWPTGSWRFQRGEHARGADDLALDINAVLAHVAKRLHHLTTLAAAGSADSVPVRLSYDRDLAAAQIPLAQTLLTVIDGSRTIAELAVRCGLTTFEAGQVLALLVESGAVGLPGPAGMPDAPAEVAAEPADPLAVDDDLSVLFDAADDDLGMQLAVLARQAEEARLDAEARRRDDITSRRRAAREAAEAADQPIRIAPAPDRREVWAAVDPPAADLPLAYDHLDALAAAVAEATSPAEESPAAPGKPTPFAAETENDESDRSETFHPATGPDESADGGLAALRDLAAAGFATPAPEDDARPSVSDAQRTAAAGGSYEPDYATADTGANPFVDSAALLRELSSLGLDDMPAPVAARTPVQRAPVLTQVRPKRKSIFGR